MINLKHLVFITILFLSFLTGCDYGTSLNQDTDAPLSTIKKDNKIQITIPEAYELSNIILALTNYGRSDEWEVEKNTDYYKEILRYFEPVKNHPLLKKVNFSRELWEDYLSFRTDAAAYIIDSLNRIKRLNDFHSVEGHTPFDNNEELINDFIEKSDFRRFFREHEKLYNKIISNYSDYYMLSEMKSFLDKETGTQYSTSDNFQYKIILSPLVGRMNCHRNIDSVTVADFPNIAISLMKDGSHYNQVERAMEIHTLFTEMDHGYVNPITDRYEKEVLKDFDYKKWDTGSGYEDLNCFNEYMTWALYDIFLDKYFPKYSDSLSMQWHYQNASRGFCASDLFAAELKRLYKHKLPEEKIDKLYPKILNYCKSVEDKIRQPKFTASLLHAKYITQSNGNIELHFTEPMKQDFDKVSCIITKTVRGKTTEEFTPMTISQERVVKWKDSKDVVLKIDAKYEEYEITFNWWGCRYPMLSKDSVMLAPYSALKIRSK